MNLGKTSIGHMFKKKVIKLERKDNVGVNNIYTSLIKKNSLKKFYFLENNLIEINQKTCKFFPI